MRGVLKERDETLPATHVLAARGKVELLLDRMAASLLAGSPH